MDRTEKITIKLTNKAQPVNVIHLKKNLSNKRPKFTQLMEAEDFSFGKLS